MRRTKYMTETQAEQRGHQVAYRALRGMAGNKHFPDYAKSHAEDIAAAKELASRHTDPIMLAYWRGYIAELEDEAKA